MERDLFGEIHIDELIKIAWEAALKRGYAIYADYTLGYAIYDDFNKYMGQKMAKGRLKPVRGGWFHYYIKRVLVKGGWIWEPRMPRYGRPEARFHPPNIGPPEGWPRPGRRLLS